MVELPSDLSNIFSIATSNSYTYWLTVGINIILSTIVGGIILIIILSVFSRKFGEAVRYQNAFLVALIINLVNIFAVGFLSTLIPYGFIVGSLVVWIVLVKAFFNELSFLHSMLIGAIGFVVALFIIPQIVSAIGGFLPL